MLHLNNKTTDSDVHSRQKRTLVDFPRFPYSKWPMPITYKFDGSHCECTAVTRISSFSSSLWLLPRILSYATHPLVFVIGLFLRYFRFRFRFWPVIFRQQIKRKALRSLWLACHCNTTFTPPSRTRQTCLVLSCRCRRCELNWRQVKTVGDRKIWNGTCLVFLQFCPVSKYGTWQNSSFSNILKTTENCLDLSRTHFTPSTRTRQDSLVLSCPCRTQLPDKWSFYCMST